MAKSLFDNDTIDIEEVIQYSKENVNTEILSINGVDEESSGTGEVANNNGEKKYRKRKKKFAVQSNNVMVSFTGSTEACNYIKECLKRGEGSVTIYHIVDTSAKGEDE